MKVESGEERSPLCIYKNLSNDEAASAASKKTLCLSDSGDSFSYEEISEAVNTDHSYQEEPIQKRF